MAKKISQVVSVTIVALMLALTFSTVIPNHQRLRVMASSSNIAETLTTPTITLGYAYQDPNNPTFLLLNVTFSEFPFSLYFRAVGRNSTGSQPFGTQTNASCSQVIAEHRWYINTTDAKYKFYYDFFYGCDAGGDYILNIWANQTTLTDQQEYNSTTLLQYVGVGSGVDAAWYVNKYNFAVGGNEYYSLQRSDQGSKEFKYHESYWFMAAYNLNDFTDPWRQYYPTLDGHASLNPGSSTWAGYGYITNSTTAQVQDHFFRMTCKFKLTNPYPVSAPLFLTLYFNATGFTTTAMNESIYQVAAQKGVKYVELHGEWMVAGTYAAYNASVNSSINTIRGWVHKYGMEFGLYFGWMAFTAKGAWTLITDRNATNLGYMQSAWSNFNATWGNLVDFYYFDFAYATPTAESRNWSWYNYYYLDPIFKGIINAGKQIIYNAGLDSWWLNDATFIPIRFEGSTYSSFAGWYTTRTDLFCAGDWYIHNLNYSQYIWITAPYYQPSPPLVNVYNITATLGMAKYAYRTGATPVISYAYGNYSDFTGYINNLEGWVGGLSLIGSVSGATGSSGVFTDATHISIYMENLPASVTISPVLLATIESSYFVNVGNVNGTSSTLTLNLVISGQESGMTYKLYVDGAFYQSRTVNDAGVISFAYSGPWSEHQLQIRSALLPASVQPFISMILIFLALAIAMPVIGVTLKSKNHDLTKKEVVSLVISTVISLVMMGVLVMFVRS